jgi:hypothetical protein
MILYLKDPKEFNRKLLDLINNVAEYKINIQNQEHFYIPTMNRLGKKSGKQFYSQ